MVEARDSGPQAQERLAEVRALPYEHLEIGKKNLRGCSFSGEKALLPIQNHYSLEALHELREQAALNGHNTAHA